MYNDYYKNKIVIVTGGANGIGKCIAEEFTNNGATVSVIDKVDGNHFVGDISDKSILEKFAKNVIDKYGHIDILVNNALPLMKGINDCSYEEFEYALAVGVAAPFYLSKLFMPYFNKNGSILYHQVGLIHHLKSMMEQMQFSIQQEELGIHLTLRMQYYFCVLIKQNL